MIVATIAFSMEMNIRNITHSINLGLLFSIPILVQQNGQAGHDLASAAFEGGEAQPALSMQLQKHLQNVDGFLQKLIIADIKGTCLIVALNIASGNTASTSRLACVEAG
ncbi:hypothetical protein BDN70DRAFT_937519 [Pholiota conissans]|uniref:Uncharacterized protein n=1 Tax=Pholiota conissans TaxID=109636 RepID=A0A9P5YRH5_9AGAR|nr:hypothetical protein BDN70DRAFT_937519 [Pholiota conissans]